MKRSVGLATAAVVLVGCAPSPPQPAASLQGSPVVHSYRDSGMSGASVGSLPMVWPKFQAGLATRSKEAELAIVLRGHELRERNPGASLSELAEMLLRDGVWDQNARFVRSERRMVVIQEALTPW
jgi:hypothetical protein